MIKYPQTFEQFRPAGFDGLFDWDFLRPAWLGTNIEPMDIDAMVERKGKILLFETKTEGKEIPVGQKIALERLLVIGRGDIHLMVIYGKDIRSIVAMEEWQFRNDVIMHPRRACDAGYVLERVSAWFRWADAQ